MSNWIVGCGKDPPAEGGDPEPWTRTPPPLFLMLPATVGGGVTDNPLGGGETASIQVGEGKGEYPDLGGKVDS